MVRSFAFAGCGVIVLAAVLVAQEGPQPGKIKSVDVDKGTITITTKDGKDQKLKVEEQTRVMGPDFKPLPERLRNKNLKPGAAVRFKVETKDGKVFLVGVLLTDGKFPPQAKKFDFKPVPESELAKLTPLTEMGDQEYQGHKGGLYPGGKNERPAGHEMAGRALARKVQPLDADGKPSPDGKIVLLTVGMSNTTQVSKAFIRLAAQDPEKNPHVLIVDGAQGGMTAAAIQTVNGGRRQKGDLVITYWGEVDRRLKEAGVTRNQVQAVWIKEADAHPSSGFPSYAKTLQAELGNIVRLIHNRFPNVRLTYLSSRTYGGYATTPLNPEPYAFESGLSVRWLIEQQLKGEPELNYVPAKGEVKAPWLSWGPYLWARAMTKRADGFYYEKSDFGGDGTHPSLAGQMKVGRLLLQFFKTDSTTWPWFVAAKK